MAEDDGSLIIPVSLDTSNVLPSLEKIAQQAGGLTGSQIKKAIETSLGSLDFYKNLGQKNALSQSEFLRTFSKPLEELAKKSPEGAQIASIFFKSFTKKLNQDFASAGDSKGISQYAQNTIKLLQREFDKADITSQLQKKADGRLISDLKKNQADVDKIRKESSDSEQKFLKELDKAHERDNKARVAREKSSADAIIKNNKALEAESIASAQREFAERRKFSALEREAIRADRKEKKKAYLEDQRIQDEFRKAEERRKLDIHQEQLNLQKEAAKKRNAPLAPSKVIKDEVAKEIPALDPKLVSQTNAALAQANRQAEQDKARQAKLLIERQKLSQVGQNDFLNFLSGNKNEVAKYSNPEAALPALKDYLATYKGSLTDAQNRALTGLIASYEGRVSRSSAASTTSTWNESKRDYKDQINARLQEINTKKLLDPSYNLRQQHSDLENLLSGVGISPLNSRMGVNDALSRKQLADLRNKEVKARLARDKAEEEAVKAGTTSPLLNPFVPDPKHIAQVRALRERQETTALQTRARNDLQALNSGPVKSIFDSPGKAQIGPLAPLLAQNELNKSLKQMQVEQTKQFVADQKTTELGNVQKAQLKALQDSRTVQKDIDNLRSKNIYGQLNSQYDANGRRLPGIPKPGPTGPNPPNPPNPPNNGRETSLTNLQNSLLTIGFSTLAIATTNLARKMVDAASTIEVAQRRLQTVIKDPKGASDYFRFLKRYEKETFYELPEVLNAGTAFATQTGQLAKSGLSKEAAVKLAGELGSLNPEAGLIEGQRAISRIIAGDPNGLEILRSKFAITNDVLKEGGARVTDSGVSLKSSKRRTEVIDAIEKYIQDKTGGSGARDQATTLGGRISTLNSQAFTSLAATIEPLIPALKTLVTMFTSILEIVEKFPPVFKIAISGGTLLTAGFFSIAAAIGGLTLMANASRNAILELTGAESLRALVAKKSASGLPMALPNVIGGGAAGGLAGAGAGISGAAIALGVASLVIGAAVIGTAVVQKWNYLGEKGKILDRAVGQLKLQGREAYEYTTDQDAFEVKYKGASDPKALKELQVEAARRQKLLQNVLSNKQILFDANEGKLDLKDPIRLEAEKGLSDLSLVIERLGTMATTAGIDLQGLGDSISQLTDEAELGNNDSGALVAKIKALPDFQKLQSGYAAGTLDSKEIQAFNSYRKQLKGLDKRGFEEQTELNLAERSTKYAKKGGSSFDDRISDLTSKKSALIGTSREEDIKRIQIEAQIEEEKFKKAKEFNKNRIDNVRLLKGEEKARVMEINQAEQDHLREIGKNEAQAKLIRAQARQDRLNAHLDMLNKLLDMEQNNIKMALDIERSQRDRGIARTETGKDIASMGDQFLSAKGRLANLSEIIGKENEVLKIKKEQTAEAIKGIKAEASATITKLERELQRGGLSKEEKAKIKDQIELEKRNRDEKVKTANETFGNEEKKSKADQTAKTTKAQQDQDKETIDQKLAILEQRKAELEYVQQKQKNDGSETEFSRQDNLQKSFEIEKKMLELKEQRAEAETPLDDEVSKDNLRRKLRLDILNLQQQYVSKLKEGTGELERQNQILELQKKIQERPAIYGIEDLNQRMKDESDLFRLQSGFGQGGKKGKGPYPGYGPKIYNGVDRQPGTFLFGDTSTPGDLQRQTANDVFKSAGEAVSRDAQGRIIKTPINKPSRADIQLPKLILPVSVELGGKTIGKETKEIDLNSFNNLNPDVKQGGKPTR